MEFFDKINNRGFDPEPSRSVLYETPTLPTLIQIKNKVNEKNNGIIN
jgi:hypothetical protein